MISPTGGLACWQLISDIRALARQGMGAFVGCSCVRARPIPAASGGVYATGSGPPLPSSPVCHSWRLEVAPPAVAHCLLGLLRRERIASIVLRWTFTRDVCWNGPLTCVPCANWGLRDRYDVHCERCDRVWHLHKSGPLSDRASGQRGTDW